jgi:plastocyanin
VHLRRQFVALVVALTAGVGSATAGDIVGRVQAPGANVDLSSFIVYVDVEGSFPPPTRPVVLDQRALRFVPHVLPILVGTTVEFANSDPLAHNVFSISPAKRFNLGLYGHGASRRVRFDRPGVVELLCNVHQEMSAYILVLKTPYFARTAEDGSFRLSGVPAGNHRLGCWHERLGETARMVRVSANGIIAEDFNLQ